ncbi:unnamed protein product, partial [Prorocentrum cordatum]
AWHRRERQKRHQAKRLVALDAARETLARHPSSMTYNTWKRGKCNRDVKNWHNRCLCGQHYRDNRPLRTAMSASRGRQDDGQVVRHIKRLPPMLHRAARTHPAYRAPPARQQDQETFRLDLQSHMDKVANMSILARKASKIERARDQKREVNWKLDKARDRLAATQNQKKERVIQEQDIEAEIAHLESCMNELKEMPDEIEE